MCGEGHYQTVMVHAAELRQTQTLVIGRRTEEGDELEDVVSKVPVVEHLCHAAVGVHARSAGRELVVYLLGGDNEGCQSVGCTVGVGKPLGFS